MQTITLVLTKTQIDSLKSTFLGDISATTPPYSLYQIKTENCTITAYTSNKVVFQGSDASIYAASFQNQNSTKQLAHAGSDEVGTGDYFGPVVVCACVISEADIKFLTNLKVNDSKVVKDSYILEIGEQLMQKITHSLLILPNEKYNAIHPTNNLNAIKAKLHNQAYLHLKEKVKMPTLAVIDQFAPEKLYYSYLKNEKEIYTALHFETKAESKYLAVACASIIARYAFLKAWQQMERLWDMSLTKGAGDRVDEDIQSFIATHGYNQLFHVAKLHFKNTPTQ